MLMYFKIPEFRLFDFIKFTELMDITIIVALRNEDMFTNQIEGWIRLDKSANIPRNVQQEKLKEKFGNFVKDAQ